MTEPSSSLHDLLLSVSRHVSDLGALSSLAICAALFLPLAVGFAGNRSQPLFHKGTIPNVLYWLLAPALIYLPAYGLMGRALFRVIRAAGMYSADTLDRIKDGIPPASLLPIAVQVLLILLLTDLVEYWIHRLFHGATLWRFHAVHHAAVNVDWLTSAQFHPINYLVQFTLAGLVVYVIGFSAEAWLLLAPINLVYSPLVHANLNWTYGPLRYVLASPVFHRWHHTDVSEGGNSNFAPTFPFIDLIFGTYYDPRDARPTVFGTPHDSVPEGNILAQLAYPFRRAAARRFSDGPRSASGTELKVESSPELR